MNLSENPEKSGETSDEEIPPPSPSPQLMNVPVNLPVRVRYGNYKPGYVLPQTPIDLESNSVHGLSLDEDERHLCLKGQPVEAVTIRQALSEFLEFLGDEPVALFAHNCKSLDALVMFNAVEACGLLAEFESKLTGFVDTVPLFKAICLSSYGQTALYNYFFHESYTAHEAMSDVRALKRLLDLPFVTPETVSQHSFGFDYIRQVVRRSLKKKTNFPSWQPMVASGSVSKKMAERAAASGLGVHHLRVAYKKFGETRVVNVLQQPNTEGKPRVTNSPKVLRHILNYIITNPVEDKCVTVGVEDN